MRRIRVIPLLLIDDGRAVVTRNFKNPIYVGDPINTVKILNDKEVDELIILDITSKKKRTQPDFDLIARLASESFMPLAYGGHVTNIKDAEKIVACGVEKIAFNSALFTHPETVTEFSRRYGKQSVVASVDIKKNWFGKWQLQIPGAVGNRMDMDSFLDQVLTMGVGEILINSVDNDGMMNGYDLRLVRHVAPRVNVPLIACGGAQSIHDFVLAIENGASAVAAGAMFYFKGGFNAVLINYPDQLTLMDRLYARF